MIAKSFCKEIETSVYSWDKAPSLSTPLHFNAKFWDVIHGLLTGRLSLCQ